MKKALVVDDAEPMRMALSNMLRFLEFECVVACDVDEAEEILSSDPLAFDLITVDLHMPGRDGVDLIKLIRGKFGITKSKVIMVTAELDSDMVATVKAAGADDYIMKPFPPSVLVDAVNRHLGGG